MKGFPSRWGISAGLFLVVAALFAWWWVGSSHRDDLQIPLSLVILPNGAPFTAAPGSVDRALIDWLSTPERGEQQITFAMPTFERGSVAPTPRFAKRLKILALILIAFDDVDIEVVARSSGTAGGREETLASRRVDGVIGLLGEADIAASRLSPNIIAFTTRRPLPPADTGESIAIVLRKRR